MDLPGSMKPSESTTDGQNLRVIMIESDMLTRILAYVAENRILAALEAKSQ